MPKLRKLLTKYDSKIVGIDLENFSLWYIFAIYINYQFNINHFTKGLVIPQLFVN